MVARAPPNHAPCRPCTAASLLAHLPSRSPAQPLSVTRWRAKRFLNRRNAGNTPALYQRAAEQVAVAGQPPAASVHALKEWAVTCAALGAGEQTLVLRKGGIAEPAFVPPARRFLLFPTSFHSGADLVKPPAAERFAQELGIEPKEQALLCLDLVADVTGAWTTADPAVVAALDAFHVWTPQYLGKRLRWRSRQPITILELSVRRMPAPLAVANAPELWGCFSWVDISLAAAAAAGEGPGGVDALWDGGRPILEDGVCEKRQMALREALCGLEGLHELQL